MKVEDLCLVTSCCSRTCIKSDLDDANMTECTNNFYLPSLQEATSSQTNFVNLCFPSTLCCLWNRRWPLPSPSRPWLRVSYGTTLDLFNAALCPFVVLLVHSHQAFSRWKSQRTTSDPVKQIVSTISTIQYTLFKGIGPLLHNLPY